MEVERERTAPPKAVRVKKGSGEETEFAVGLGMFGVEILQEYVKIDVFMALFDTIRQSDIFWKKKNNVGRLNKNNF